jgi:hypothetical protein
MARRSVKKARLSGKWPKSNTPLARIHYAPLPQSVVAEVLPVVDALA